MIDEAELVSAAQSGNAAALGILLEHHRARLYATALAILSNQAQAQDAVQDTFLVALRRIQELREPGAVGGWLLAIVRNACRMRLRSQREFTGAWTMPAGTPWFDAGEPLDRLIMRDWIWTTLEALPVELRATVMLRYFSRHTAYAEIAAILGVPVGTVRSRLNQAKRLLAAALTASADTAHRDHSRLVEQRWCWWKTVVDQIEREGSAACYVADSTSDALVESLAIGYRSRGATDHGQGMVETIAAGVRVQMTGIVASEYVTIVESTFENPVNDPRHCPAMLTEVRFHPTGRTSRIILYYGFPADLGQVRAPT